ncbi:hypothetical protein CSUI_009456 [Cystoisospora suis]|uniref:Uncharacterized protein n=1 Tax=Cystoisospora suis TaxID=483139 RepID=A0A2C6KK31_9APIC|nr:hypothetical protein CSUI_009456 [Cystoisospora suis]
MTLLEYIRSHGSLTPLRHRQFQSRKLLDGVRQKCPGLAGADSRTWTRIKASSERTSPRPSPNSQKRRYLSLEWFSYVFLLRGGSGLESATMSCIPTQIFPCYFTVEQSPVVAVG